MILIVYALIVTITITEIKLQLMITVNLSSSTGQFSNQLKIAKIVPMFNFDHNTAISN